MENSHNEIVVINWSIERIDALSHHIKAMRKDDEFIIEVMTDITHLTQILRMALDDSSTRTYFTELENHGMDKR